MELHCASSRRQARSSARGVPTKGVLLECKVCKNPLLGVSEITQVGPDEWEWDSASRLWPAPETEVGWEIPELARNSLIEAKICFKAKAYSACAVICGRAVEGLCKHHDGKIETLAAGLKKLKDDGVIDNRLFNWGEALRENRNLGAHATTEKVSKDDARDLLDFSHDSKPASFRPERKSFGVFDDLVGQIDLKIGPVVMPRGRFFHAQDLSHRHVFEPWKIGVGQEEFVAARQQPDAVAGNVGDLSRRSGRSKRA